MLSEVLAGQRGRSTDYQRTRDFGYTRQPFTWLSSSSLVEDNQRLAETLVGFKRSREAVRFEAWEFGDGAWQLVLSGQVRVIFAEVDGRLAKVRALLQWAPSEQGSGSSA